MAKTIAYIYGTGLEPGVSKNRRLYTKAHIQGAVKAAQPRIAAGQLLSVDLDEASPEQLNPMSSLTHHAADDDSEKIVGRIDHLSVDENNRMRYKIAVANTPAGRNILELTDTSDGQPAFLRGMSIRAAWVGKVRQVRAPDGDLAETADSLELDGLDFTRKPGVPGALIDKVVRVGATNTSESASERTPIYESFQEARVEFVETVDEAAKHTARDNMVPGCDGTCCDNCGVNTKDAQESVHEKGAAALKSGKAATPQTKAQNYADPGYQDDKMKRYALDTKSQAKAAWSYINQAKNAKNYTAAQLKRIKQRIIAALKKFGVKVNTQEGWIIDTAVEEMTALAEYADGPGGGSFAIELTNGPVCLRMSSYCIDPADLEVIGVAAMRAAVDALKGLDPDLDADIDVPGADAEDTDDDNMESQQAQDSVVTEKTTVPQEGGAGIVEEESPVADKPDATAADAAAATTPPAAQPAPAAPAVAPSVTLTDEQFGQLLARIGATPAPPTPATPEKELVGAGAPAESAAAATEQVTETEDQRVARLVAEGIKAALPGAVQEHVAQNGPPPRKGLVAEHRAPGGAGAGAADSGYPENWPTDEAGNPLEAHKMTQEQWRRVSRPAIEQAFMGRHSVYNAS